MHWPRPIMLQHLTASCCLIPARTIMDLLPASTVGHYDYSGICRKYDRSYLYVFVLNLSHTYKNALAKAHNAPTLIPSPFFLESASVTSTIPVTLEPKKIRALLLWLSVTYYRGNRWTTLNQAPKGKQKIIWARGGVQIIRIGIKLFMISSESCFYNSCKSTVIFVNLVCFIGIFWQEH